MLLFFLHKLKILNMCHIDMDWNHRQMVVLLSYLIIYPCTQFAVLMLSTLFIINVCGTFLMSWCLDCLALLCWLHVKKKLRKKDLCSLSQTAQWTVYYVSHESNRHLTVAACNLKHSSCRIFHLVWLLKGGKAGVFIYFSIGSFWSAGSTLFYFYFLYGTATPSILCWKVFSR